MATQLLILYHQNACHLCPIPWNTVHACLNSKRSVNCLPAMLRLRWEGADCRTAALGGSPWIENQHALTTEIREFRRVGGRFEFGGLPEVDRGSLRNRASPALHWRPQRFAMWFSCRSRSGVARDCAPASGRDAVGVDGGGSAFRGRSPISPISCAPSATRFCRMGRWTIMPRPSWRGFAANRKTAASDSAIAARIFAAAGRGRDGAG